MTKDARIRHIAKLRAPISIATIIAATAAIASAGIATKTVTAVTSAIATAVIATVTTQLSSKALLHRRRYQPNSNNISDITSYSM